MFLRNIEVSPNYTALQPGRSYSSLVFILNCLKWAEPSKQATPICDYSAHPSTDPLLYIISLVL
jgi:hypothetical protein